MAVRSAEFGRSPQIEAVLDQHQVKWEFEQNVPLDDIKDVEGMQVRLDKNRAPREMVEKYAAAMLAGGARNFPGIVLGPNLEIIDGNTRREAAKRAKRTEIAAYILKDVNPITANSIAMALNNINGKPMEEEEVKAHVLAAAADSYALGQEVDVKAMALKTSTKEATIQRWVDVQAFDRRAQREGLDPDVVIALSDTAKQFIKDVRDREAFKLLADATVRAGIKTPELKKIVREIKVAEDAATENGGLDVVQKVRADRAAELAPHIPGIKARAFRGTAAAMHVGALAKMSVDDLSDVPPVKQPEVYARYLALRDRLDAVIARAEREWNLSAPSSEAAA